MKKLQITFRSRWKN